MTEYVLNINRKKHTVNVEKSTPLLWVLRDTLGFTGTKFGCGKGLCGACTVLANNVSIRSCSLPVESAVNMDIVTIEGLSEKGDHPVQLAWVEEDVSQCGYCQGGQILSAVSLLNSKPKPSEEDINHAMQGNLCRCGTYPRIKKAIKRAAAK